MKKIIITLTLLVSFKVGFSQTEKTKSYYDGMSTEEVLDYLNDDEEKSFFLCLQTAGVDTSKIVWFQKDLRDSISTNRNYCNILNVSKNTSEDFVKTRIKKGENYLEQPQCMIFIMRQENNTHILFQLYY